MRIVAREVDNLSPPISVFLGRFVLDLSATLSDASRELATLTLEVTALVGDAGLRPPYVHQV